MLLRAFLATMLFSSLSMGATYYLATDNTGAQTQIDVNHSSTWVLNVGTTFDLGGGLFSMKAGNSATDTVSFNLYSGSDATGTLLASVTLDNATFCAQAANCGTYVFHQFFISPVTLLSGQTYYAALTSSAPDTQSQAYFIKSDTFFVSDENGTPVVPSPLGPGPVTETPEPSTVMLSGLGLVMLGFLGRKVRR
jgi:hypothetical protein